MEGRRRHPWQTISVYIKKVPPEARRLGEAVKRKPVVDSKSLLVIFSGVNKSYKIREETDIQGEQQILLSNLRVGQFITQNKEHKECNCQNICHRSWKTVSLKQGNRWKRQP